MATGSSSATVGAKNKIVLKDFPSLETPGCTAVNYDNSSTHCVLRGCDLPVAPPAENVYKTFDGYWLSSTSTGDYKQVQNILRTNQF